LKNFNSNFSKRNSLHFRLRFEGAANTFINNCLKSIDIVLEKAKLQADDIKLVIRLLV
jgi:hypothetical protein